MAKLTELTPTTTLDDLDVTMFVDVSDLTMDTDGTNKKISWGELKTLLGTTPAPSGNSGIKFNDVTGTTVNALVNNGYVTNNASLVTVTLPATANVGDIVGIQGSGVGGWRLAQNASQTIYWDSGATVGLNLTTTGATGYLASTDKLDAIEVMCVVANISWVVRSSKGNISVN